MSQYYLLKEWKQFRVPRPSSQIAELTTKLTLQCRTPVRSFVRSPTIFYSSPRRRSLLVSKYFRINFIVLSLSLSLPLSLSYSTPFPLLLVRKVLHSVVCKSETAAVVVGTQCLGGEALFCVLVPFRLCSRRTATARFSPKGSLNSKVRQTMRERNERIES